MLSDTTKRLLARYANDARASTETARKDTADRDWAIREALKAGGTLGEVAKATGLNRSRVAQIKREGKNHDHTTGGAPPSAP